MPTPRVVNSTFIKSAQSISDSLDDSTSEVVYLGRSNVGKSSTINTLAKRKNLAKSSSTPGKTQLINFFEIDYRLGDTPYMMRYVDLPGFGYAKVSKTLKEIWQKNLVEFIEERISIRLFIHLRDARHPDAKIDNEVQEYLESFVRPDQRYLALFTKIDKLNRKEKTALKKKFPNSIFISNSKKIGEDIVHKEIFKTVYGIDCDEIN